MERKWERGKGRRDDTGEKREKGREGESEMS